MVRANRRLPGHVDGPFFVDDAEAMQVAVLDLVERMRANHPSSRVLHGDDMTVHWVFSGREVFDVQALAGLDVPCAQSNFWSVDDDDQSAIALAEALNEVVPC
jgi:hypothetical protein